MALDPLGHRQERDIDLVDAEHLGEPAARVLAHRQLDLRVALVEDGERQRDVDRPHRVHRADGHVPALHAAHGLELGARGIELGEDPAGPGDEQLARGGDRDRSRRPLRERDADLILQAPDLLGEGRLRDVLPGRGAGEAALVGERDEVAELPEFHKHSL